MSPAPAPDLHAKSWTERSLVTGLIIGFCQMVGTVVAVWGTESFGQVLTMQVVGFVAGVAALIDAQRKHPSVDAKTIPGNVLPPE